MSAAVWTELSGTKSTPACAAGFTAVDLYIEVPIGVPSVYVDEVHFEAPQRRFSARAAP